MNFDIIQCPQCDKSIQEGHLIGHMILEHTAAPYSWPDTDEYRNLLAAIVRGIPEAGFSRRGFTCTACGERYTVESTFDRAIVMEQKWLVNHSCFATNQ